MKQLRSSLDLHGLRWNLEGLAVEGALLHLQLALKLFNPLQPRVPAGYRDGGRWTDDESPFIRLLAETEISYLDRN